MHTTYRACVLLALLSYACASSVYVISAHNGDGLNLAHKLTDIGFSVHGFYEEVVVVSTQHSKLHESLKDLPVQVHYEGEVEGDAQYYMLERPDLAFETYTTPIEVPDVFTVMHSSHKRVIVSVLPTHIPATIHAHTFTHNLEVIPINMGEPIHLGVRRELVPMIASVYKSASMRFLSAPDPTISRLVDQVDPKVLTELVTYLTGEDPESNIFTRNARSPGALDAQAWLEIQFSRFGLTTFTHQFNTLYSSNVVGVRLGATDPSKVVVVGAHYDSRGPDISSTTQRAPGANDNGSGTGAMLHIAKIFNETGAKFDYTIHFIVYSGEEQGLLGSAAYAQKLINERVNVIGVLNADMIAFRVPGERLQCAFPSRYSTPDLEVLAREAVFTYVPDLTIGITTACCSDHQSYYNKGLPATGFFERNGAIADNQYHKSADLVNRTGYDVEGQYAQLTKGVLATLATLAGAIKA